MATVPTMSTASAGGVLTAAIWNGSVRDGVNWFLSARPLAVLRQTVAQSLANNTTVAITMDVEDADRDSAHSLVTNTSRYTSATAGWYLIKGGGGFTGGASGRVEVGLRVNGTTFVGFTNALNFSGTPHQSVVGVAFLAVGDYVELTMLQSSGGALNTTVANGNPRLEVLWIAS